MKLTNFQRIKSFPKITITQKKSARQTSTKKRSPAQKFLRRTHKSYYTKENTYLAFILASISSTASSTALSTPICSSIVRQACNTVE